jgi:hypothetical protein
MPGGVATPNTKIGLPAIDNAIATAAETNGNGVPTIAGAKGDRFWRIDTAQTAGSRLYICTVAGAAGVATWVATAI